MWKDEALQFIIDFPKKTFQAEDVRLWAYESGFRKPSSERAWGQVIKNAEKIGIIKREGFALVDNPLAHKTPASVWTKIL